MDNDTISTTKTMNHKTEKQIRKFVMERATKLNHTERAATGENWCWCHFHMANPIIGQRIKYSIAIKGNTTKRICIFHMNEWMNHIRNDKQTQTKHPATTTATTTTIRQNGNRNVKEKKKQTNKQTRYRSNLKTSHSYLLPMYPFT